MQILIDDDISPYYGVTADRVNKQLKSATGDITVEISSDGGDVFEAVRIFNLLKNYTKGKITTVIMGQAVSAASYIFLAGEERVVYSNSAYMAHPPSSGVWGTYVVVQERANYLKGVFGIFKRDYSRISNRTENEIEAELIAEKWLFGQEILDSGFATEIKESGELEVLNKTDSIASFKEKALACNARNSQECLKNFKKEGYSEELKSMASLLDTIDKPTQIQQKENDMDVTTSNGIKVFAATASSEDKNAIVALLGGVDSATLTAKNDEVATLTASHTQAIADRDTQDGVKLLNMQTSMKAVLTMVTSESFGGVAADVKMKTLDEVTLLSDGGADMVNLELSLHKAMASSSAPQTGGDDSLNKDEVPEDVQKMSEEF